MSLDEALLREDCAISESKLQLLWEFPLIMTADGDDIAANMTEIKVRLWGTDIGIGISRCTAIVHSSFMPEKLLSSTVQLSTSAFPRDRIGNRESESKQGSTINSKRGISPAAASKRKRKALISPAVEDAKDDQTPSTDLNRPIYDSETGEGTRPTVSYLTPQSSLFDYTCVSSSPTNKDGSLMQTEACSDSKAPHSTVEPSVSNSAKNKPRTAASSTINKFWKLIDDENYFQPFSKKAGTTDDLCLRGGDYDDLLRMTPLLRNHEVCMKDRDCDAAPFLENIQFEDPIPVLSFLESHGDQRSLLLTDNKSEQGMFGLNVDKILYGHESHKDDVRDSETASSSSFANESSGIGFLYQRLVASFVLLSGKKEDLSIDLKSMATHPGIPSSNGSIERRLPDSNSSLNGVHEPEYNAGHVQAELRNGSENFNSAVNAEKSVAKCTNNVNQEDRLPASILNFTHDISCEAVVNTRATEIGTDVSSYNGVCNGYGYGNGNGIHHRGDTNPLKMEIEIDIEVERNINDTVVNNCHEKNNLMSSNAYPLVVCVQSDTEDTKECTLSLDQRTIIELAEIGILHPFDCPPIETEKVEIKMEIEVEVSECYSESTPPCGITEYFDEINKRDYELQGLSKHLEGNRIDDDICLSIRYMVKDLKETETGLNKRISNLRKILDQPSVKDESDVHKRATDLSKILIARWQKLRKKGKTVAKTVSR